MDSAFARETTNSCGKKARNYPRKSIVDVFEEGKEGSGIPSMALYR